MKLNSAQVKQILKQLEAQVIPDDHPLARELSEMFGDHTFFLDSNGLNAIEPNEDNGAGTRAGRVVKLADWTDAQLTGLSPHDPEPTAVIVTLRTEH